jgi:hypothetical protein
MLHRSIRSIALLAFACQAGKSESREARFHPLARQLQARKHPSPRQERTSESGHGSAAPTSGRRGMRPRKRRTVADTTGRSGDAKADVKMLAEFWSSEVNQDHYRSYQGFRLLSALRLNPEGGRAWQGFRTDAPECGHFSADRPCWRDQKREVLCRSEESPE